MLPIYKQFDFVIYLTLTRKVPMFIAVNLRESAFVDNYIRSRIKSSIVCFPLSKIKSVELVYESKVAAHYCGPIVTSLET